METKRNPHLKFLFTLNIILELQIVSGDLQRSCIFFIWF